MKKSGNGIKILLIIIPLILGVIGFAVLAKEPILDSIFKCITMYVLNYGDVPPNALVEIARWLAPFATVGAAVMVIQNLRYRIINRVRAGRSVSVAVYGEEEQKKELQDEIGKNLIFTENKPVQAANHILMWDEEKNFQFLNTHKERLSGSEVYIKCESISSQTMLENGANIHLFSSEETAARLFWKENCLYEISARNQHKMKLVLISFGSLGEELLIRGIQNNIFSPDQKIEYHIFGEENGFLKIYHELDNMEDRIIFHNDKWYDNIELLEESSMLIVVEQKDQVNLVHKIVLSTVNPLVTVFTSGNLSRIAFSEEKRIVPFDWIKIASKLENIMGENLYKRAKAINQKYADMYQGPSWEKLDTFTRYSNISSSDYHEVRLKILEAMNKDSHNVEGDLLELLSELEHMRWCRFHWINNWKLGKPEDGSRKDRNSRIHTDLVPYAELSESEKQKDRENILTLLDIQ